MVARNLSDKIIKGKTGKNSQEWYKILDNFQVKNHTLMAKHLREEYKVNPWWTQIITNRYEWARGLRTS